VSGFGARASPGLQKPLGLDRKAEGGKSGTLGGERRVRRNTQVVTGRPDSSIRSQAGQSEAGNEAQATLATGETYISGFAWRLNVAVT
jgi:hypothetical protein